ncbi:MAG: Txe/YoeB family addiction module toxin [Candidatus Parabeggiatoa sp. nov. 1]|nr:MAG: Txe/YoeB family addiction module toxin [Gammaproteobacteria bacterium]
MRELAFKDNSWQQYEEIIVNNKKRQKKFHEIVKEMLRSSDLTQGIGKPEPLKYEMEGKYSRRLSEKDRLVYSFDDRYIYVHSIGGHYGDH